MGVRTIILATVGSTKFDALIDTVLHPVFIDSLAPDTRLIVQHGASTPSSSSAASTVASEQVTLFDYTPDLTAYIHQADIVISHAGSGTIIEALRSSASKKLIVVPNQSLMDNHQAELALALSKLNHLLVADIRPSSPANENAQRLAHVVASSSNARLTPFPPQDPASFRRLVDEAMGF
ncbi:N-acetylglucosaminyldiphosphodolichol N-acetylglucosaminyltransferase catalytic subunit alg13 [Tilletia horrida]|uniref:UDP-N-acetylglucosamine transferase subunit ALG13 n=1 Tax=Tilletia horrida TaxID=155126 RepID=A0AAN6GNB7_9BASI|nr:N-acetylglucosaminyldiphosphodolichol N-acetylglucosaminyltransferase catalytic subunit alg13 [Tilletia horrida]KAK0561055.1 N-acetylglucosaminyldiphosphodolichol N-acetylglucosaminyltransferase catalytic subunit alg13 [Tilletia horrida]